MFLHVAVLTVNPRATVTSNVLITFTTLLAALGCMERAYRGPAETKALWILIGSAFLLAAAGQVGSTYHELVTNTQQTTALSADFFFFVYGIPILLAISSRNADSGLRGFFWLDGAQASLAAVLIYLHIFSSSPSLGDRTPISATNLMYLYNVENFILAGAVTLRLFANPGPAKKHLYRILSIYLWVYASVALVLGYMELKLNLADGWQDVAWGIPALSLLAALAFWSRALKEESKVNGEHRSIALLIDNLGPALFALAVVVMGAGISPEHRWLGFASVITAVVLYGLRAAFLQRKYVQSQHELAKSGLALVEANERLLELSIRDSLTGVHNRRHFDEAFQAECRRARRTRQAFSLLLIDVDCFKALNDRYGHQAGDECLRAVAQTLRTRLRRPGDILARYGGEEFAAILPGADLQGALLIAEAMRLSVAELEIPNETSTAETIVTVSIGVSSAQFSLKGSAAEILELADAALYRAKLNGRNQIQFPNEHFVSVVRATCTA
jgi:diguanylate cyclase (GGDEF)-like protein